MKVKAVLKGNEIEFSELLTFNKPELEVEVDLPDDAVKVYTNEEIEKMTIEELSHLIWGRQQLSEEQIAHINKDYKELIIEALGESYKEQ